MVVVVVAAVVVVTVVPAGADRPTVARTSRRWRKKLHMCAAAQIV